MFSCDGFDDRPLGRIAWDNRPEGYLFETTLSGLTGEDPRLQLRVPSRTVGEDPRPRADVVLLDWVEVEYTRRPEAPTAALLLEASGCGRDGRNLGEDALTAFLGDLAPFHAAFAARARDERPSVFARVDELLADDAAELRRLREVRRQS